jgi:iron-sulfur cluster repair protein YtfE (RIC family)
MIDLSIMMAAHDAFRRDLVKIARYCTSARLDEPIPRLAVTAGWATFRRQLIQHHRAEDDFLLPAMRDKLSGNGMALSILDDMDAEHAAVDPLLAAINAALAEGGAAVDGAVPAEGELGDIVDELVRELTGHLIHEERDLLPMVGEALTDEEWAGLTVGIRSQGSVEDAMEMVPWLLAGRSADDVAHILRQFPPIVARRYATEWQPAFEATPRW